MEESDWYDGDWFRQDTEPIYGLAFVSLQNYINGSIYDLTGEASNKLFYYKITPNLHGFENTAIELIIALANYSKHKDEKPLHLGTQKALTNFGLKYDDVYDSPVFDGLEKLDKDYNLFTILKTVADWRETMWLNSETED